MVGVDEVDRERVGTGPEPWSLESFERPQRPRRHGELLTWVLAVVGSGLVLDAASKPFGDVEETLSGVIALMVAGVVWCYLAVRLAGRRWDREDPRRPGPRLLVVPIVIVAATVGLLSTDLPFDARWALVRSDFEAAVVEGQAVEPSTDDVVRDDGRRTIGGITVIGTEVSDAGVAFTLTGGLYRRGIAFWPDGVPEYPGPGYATAFADGWYLWTAPSS